MPALLEGEVRQRPKEILASLPALYMRAAESGMNLSHYLERHVDPSDEWQGDSWGGNKTAFERVMSASRIIWKSEPDSGIWADRFGEIYANDESRALIPEYANYVFRKTRAQGYVPQNLQHVRFLLTSQDEALGSSLRPYVDAAGAYQDQLAPAIPLAEVVAFTTPVEGTSYRRVYLTDPDPTVKRARVGEYGEIPRARVATSQRAVDLFKYARAIELSYEQLRRTTIDKVGFFIAQSAVQLENDRFAQAVDVLINGDGNSGTAATVYAHSTLDTGTTLTIRGWLAFKALFAAQGYQLTHAFARGAELLNLQTLQFGTSNTFLINVQDTFGFGGIAPIGNRYAGVVRYGQTEAVAAAKYLGIDRRYALERLTEIGSDIQETQRFITRQAEVLTFSDVDGYAILDANANKILNLA